MPLPDTFKQGLLGDRLQERGIEGGWRAWLLACRRQGMSASAIARLLARDMALEMDDATLSRWIKQAQRDADNREDESPAPLPTPGQK